MNIIYAAKLEEDAKLPTRKHWDDAGIDLYSLDEVEIDLHENKIIRTGVTIEIPHGYVGIIKAKSKSNFIVGAGVVDSGYQGELLVKVFNPTMNWLVINKGEAVAQLLMVPCLTGEVLEKSSSEIHSEPSTRGKSGGIATQLSFISDIISDEEVKKFIGDSNESK